MTIKFGPAGLGSLREAILNLQKFHKLGIRACEISFTYGVYIKKEKDAKKIKKFADEYEINLSIHAPYYINLNSEKKEIIEKSKQRILECLKVGTWLGAKKVVFHPGYYTSKDKKETYENIKNQILELQETKEKEKYTPELAPETTGKVNVFGSINEIASLVKETKCNFCIDFAHILAREKNYKFSEVFDTFKQKDLHIHFSGIEYGEKGERHHKKTPVKDFKILIETINKNKRDAIIINESPNPIEDSLVGLGLYKKLTKCNSHSVKDLVLSN